MVTVQITEDRDVLRRWMMRPSILKGVMRGLPMMSAKELEDAFEETMVSDSIFYLVMVDGQEKGCIIFKRGEGFYEMHLCLATWYTRTREAVRKAMAQLDQPIMVCFVAANRAMTRLLDDLGFSEPEKFFGYYTDETWHIRKLPIPVDSFVGK